MSTKNVGRNSVGRKTSARFREQPAGSVHRRRILRAARRLIDLRGVDGLTMLSVSKRAGVAEKTLYNLFGNKNALIAAVVRQYELDTALLGARAPRGLAEILEAALAPARDLLREVRWAEAISHLYFSTSTSSQTLAILKETGVRHVLVGIAEMREAGVRIDERTLAAAVDNFSNAGFALVREVALGRLRGEHFMRQLAFTFITTLALMVDPPLQGKLWVFACAQLHGRKAAVPRYTGRRLVRRGR